MLGLTVGLAALVGCHDPTGSEAVRAAQEKANHAEAQVRAATDPTEVARWSALLAKAQADLDDAREAHRTVWDRILSFVAAL